MRYVKGIPGRITEAEGQSFLFFSGFAYLGMPSLPAFQELLGEGIKKYGAVFPSSRVSNTRFFLYETFEEALSAYVGLPASASFSSGYLAAQAAVQFAMSTSRLLYPESIHPSLKCALGKEAIASGGSSEFILEQIHSSVAACTVVLESVNPLTGEITDFKWLLKIKRPVRVIIDDSHGIGLLGRRGGGVSELLPESDHLHYLICYSLGKAFSCEGGAVSGAPEAIREIKSSPPFSAATPMSPAFVYAWMKSGQLFQEQRMALQENCRYFFQKTSGLKGLAYDRRFPVACISHKDFYEKALKHRILLSAFRYPTEKDPLMTRAVLNALHTREDIDRLVHCICS